MTRSPFPDGSRKATARYRFDGWLLEAESRTLQRGERRVTLGRGTAALLQTLLDNPGRPVPRSRLALAAGIAAESPGARDAVLNLLLRRLRRALGESPRRPSRVAALAGRGVLLDCTVEVTGASPRGVADRGLPHSGAGTHGRGWAPSTRGRRARIATAWAALVAAVLLALLAGFGPGVHRGRWNRDVQHRLDRWNPHLEPTGPGTFPRTDLRRYV